MKKLIMLIGLLMFIVSCAQPETVPSMPLPSASSVKTVELGALLPLTGDAASYGLAMQKGIDLAVKEVNAEGGIQFTVNYQDGKCSPGEAVTGAQKLFADRVPAIIGEGCSSATLAVAPLAERNKVVLISPASTNPDIANSGDYIFRTVPSDANQGKEGAALVARLGYKKLAILHSNEDYGIGFKKVLEENFKASGGQVVAIEANERTAADAKTQLTKIKSKNPDALYVIQNSPPVAGVVLKQAKELGIKAQIFATEGLKDQSVVSSARGGAEGMILLSVSAGTPKFVARHKAVYGSEPGPFAAQSYDAALAVMRAVVTSDGTGSGIKDALYAINFAGASGTIAFDANGEIAGGYTIEHVKNGTFVPFK